MKFLHNNFGDLPSIPFVYRLSCYSKLSIFYHISNLINLVWNAFKLFFLVCVGLFSLGFLKLLCVCICWIPCYLLIYFEHGCLIKTISFSARDSYGTFALGLVGMHFAAASFIAVTIFTNPSARAGYDTRSF